MNSEFNISCVVFQKNRSMIGINLHQTNVSNTEQVVYLEIKESIQHSLNIVSPNNKLRSLPKFLYYLFRGINFL